MKTHIIIDRINIRLKGVSSRTAQAAANGLDSELLRNLARDPACSQSRPQELQGNIASAMSGAINARIKRVNSKGV
jgi:hypothetical protein